MRWRLTGRGWIVSVAVLAAIFGGSMAVGVTFGHAWQALFMLPSVGVAVVLGWYGDAWGLWGRRS